MKSHLAPGAALLALTLGLAACGSVRTTPVPQDDLPENRGYSAPAPFVAPPGAFVLLNADVPLGEAAVWSGGGLALEACRQPPGAGQASPASCLAQGMEASGASGPAVAAARWLSEAGDPGWLSGWRREGPIAIATVTRPFRANTNTETLLVPPMGEVVAVDDAPVLGFETDPNWSGFKAKNPNAFPVAPSELIASERHLTGWRLIYGAPLRDCRACADLGRMMTAYDFDSSGAYKGRSLLSAQ